MLHLLVIARENTAKAGLYMSLTKNGFVCSFVSNNDEVIEQVSRQPPDLLLVEIDGHSPNSTMWELIQNVRHQRHLPAIALVSKEMLESMDGHLDLDDFILSPYDTRELILRVSRLIHHTRDTESNELLECNGLVIDLAKCEVTIEGRIVELTFREYELLKFLVSNKGRVYNREILLNRVWGYDYYGGDRTVDVHIRRLRSKIEDSGHYFIETVRNIGYRFRREI